VSDLLAPTDEGAIAAAILQAATAQEPLAVSGNGTKLAMLRPVQAARSLSTRNLTGITLYSPNELIISARAGTPLSEVEAALAEHGQHIIAEPPDPWGPQTIGGIVATNLSGPRRVAWGAMRDHVLGVRAVTGRGEVIHSGGRVLKNVTGLDLCKLLTGSHGTLAVITEVTLKVLPAPEAAGTLVLPGLDAAGVALLSAALGSPYSVSAAAWLPADAAARIPLLAPFNDSVALVRIEEFASSVAYRVQKLRDDLGGRGQILDDTASRSVWRAIRDREPLVATTDEAVWRVSVRPSAGAQVLRQIANACGARGYLDWGGGLVWLAGPATVSAHEVVQRAALGVAGSWTLVQGPKTLRVAVDVIPPESETLARITRRVKEAFDPYGILNPGRLYAGL
jgi:glycolate oxidase FAD binding subunit